MDQAEQIRRRIRELSEGTPFPASLVAEQMGPEAVEIEFDDRSGARAGRERAARDAAAIANPRDMTTVVGDPGGLYEPRTSEARSQDDLVDPGGGLTLPNLAPPVAAPAAPRRPVFPNLQPRVKPRNPTQEYAERKRAQEQSAASAAAATALPEQRMRDRRRAREQAAAPGGLNVHPGRVAADREAAYRAGRKPAPAQSGKDELRDRETRARESKEIEDYRFAVAQHGWAMREWRSRLDEAYETGNDALARQLAANEPEPPEAPLSVTGGLESNEFRATFDHDNNPATPRVAETAEQTLARLQQNSPASYEALQRAARMAVGAPRQVVTNRGRSAYARDPKDGSVVYDADPALVKEWFSNSFGDMEPSERYDAMDLGGGRLATSRPQLVVPRGSATGIGTPGRRPPAPLDYDDSQLDPRTGKPVVIRDPFNNGRPETMPGGGRLATPSGNVTRAPENSAALESLGIDLNTFDPNPERMSPAWREQMQAIGLFAFPELNRDAYAEGPDGDSLYVAAVQEALARHQEKMAAGYDTQRVVTGGTRYAPGQEMVDRRRQRGLSGEVNAFVQSNPAGAAAEDPETGTPYGTLLLEAAAAGDANTVRDLMAAARREGQANRSKALADNRSREADQQNRRNPRRAPGMFRDSLARAGDDPMAIAAVYRDWGMPEEAERILAMDNQRLGIEVGGRVGLAQVDAEREPDGLEIMRASDAQIVDGLLNPTDATRPMATETAIDIFSRVHPEKGMPLPRKKAAQGVARLLVQIGQPAAMAHPLVQGVLNDIYSSIWSLRPENDDAAWLASRRTTFISEANVHLSMDEETAGREFDSRTRPAAK